MSITFDQLPEAIEQVNRRLEKIEILLSDPGRYQQREDKLLRLPAAAEYCTMPVSTFRAHLYKRNVTGSKPGKHWVFRKEDLDEFLLKFRHKTSDELIKEANDYIKK